MDKLFSIPDSLYDLAFEFKQVKLWKKLYDTQIFAVRLSDGEIGYCCVMGKSGEHFALAVYPGDEGLYSYRLFASDWNSYKCDDYNELPASQNCVMLSFESKDYIHPYSADEVRDYCKRNGKNLRGANAFPCFERFKPGLSMWRITNEVDAKYIKEAIEAAMEVAEKLESAAPEELGLYEGAPYDREIPLLTKTDSGYEWSTVGLPMPILMSYPVGKLDDKASERIKAAKKTRRKWALHIFMHTEQVAKSKERDEYDLPLEAPFFPFIMLILDEKKELIIANGISSEPSLYSAPDDYSEDFTQILLDTIKKHGQPEVIHVVSDRTESFLTDIAAKTGLKVERQESNKHITEMMEDFSNNFGGKEKPDAVETALDMLRSPETIKQLPDEILYSSFFLFESDEIPDDVKKAIIREIERRRNEKKK